MEKVKLGKTKFNISRMCFGSLTFSYLQRAFTPKKAAKLLLSAFERGINIVDTAELYDNYEAIRLALSEWNGEEILISTKCYAYDAATARASLEKALKALKRERIDIFMLHEQESEHTLRGHSEALEYFDKQKDAGKIGAIGMSTHFVAGAEAAAKHPLIEVVHPIYNWKGLGIVDGSREQMEGAVRSCHNAGKGIIAMKPFGGGHLIREREKSLDYVLSDPHVHSIAVGMQSLAEIEYNTAYFEGRDAKKYADQISCQKRELMIENWCAGCGKCIEKCQQSALSISSETGKTQVNSSRCVLCGYCASSCPDFCIKVI